MAGRQKLFWPKLALLHPQEAAEMAEGEVEHLQLLLKPIVRAEVSTLVWGLRWFFLGQFLPLLRLRAMSRHHRLVHLAAL